MAIEVDVRNLKENEAVFIEGSDFFEKRLYRYNKSICSLEYSDDGVNWSVSSIELGYLNSLNLLITKI